MNLLATLLLCLSVNPQADTIHLTRGTYIGQMPAGTGKIYDNERGLYLGRFDRTVPSGRGVHFRRDGGKYAGNFVKGVYQGYGRYFTSTGAVICGVFSDGKANGRDTLFYPNGKVFIGTVQNNGPTQYGRTYKNARAAGADGKISDVTILSTTNEEYSKKLVKVIKRSPRWQPALKDGGPVPYIVRNQRVFFNMPH